MPRWLLLLPLLTLAPLAGSGPDPKTPPKAPELPSLRARPIGPGLYSGRIVGLAVDPRDAARWYVAVASGGVWRTDNAGTSWTPLFDDQGSYSIGCVVLDPKNPDVVWVGTGENNAQRSVGYGDGVYRSPNGGKTWEKVGLATSEHIGKILLDPRDPSTVYVAAQGPLWKAGGERGLYKSTDAGKTWTQSLKISDDTGVTDVVLDPKNPDVLLAAAHQRRRHVWTLVNGGPESALYRSTDAGKTWKKITAGLPGGDLGRIGLAVAPSNPSIVYATVEATEGKGGVFRSADGGLTWERRNPFDAIAMYYSHVVVEPTDAERIYVMNVHVQVSEDGGRTLKPMPARHVHVDHHTIWVDPANPRHLLLGNDGGLYESHDRAATWRHHANLPVTQFYDVCVGGKGPFYRVYGGTQDNATVGGPARSRNSHGVTNGDWAVVQGGDGFQARVDPTDPDIVYAEAQYGDLVRHDRRTGESVGIQPKPKAGEPALRWNWDSPLLLSAHDPKRLYFAANIVFRSDDRGDTWTPISPDLSRKLDRDRLPVMGKMWSIDAVYRHGSTSHYGNVTTLAESPLDAKLLYAGTDDGLIHVSADGGKAWRKAEKAEGVEEGTFVARVVPSAHKQGRVYAVFNNHKKGDFRPLLFRSDDDGKTWKRLAAGLPENGPLWCVVEDHKDEKLLFVGSEFGLFVSVDGELFQRFRGGLPTIPVRDLAVQRDMDDLVIGTFGRGFYVVDDYSPLRGMKGDAGLYPPRKAFLYVPARPLGGGPKGWSGEALFVAENPPFGATLTYRLANVPKTKKQRRQEAEKAGKIEAPTPEQLRAEEEEEAPSVVVEIREGEDVIRRLTGPTAKGSHRVTWDLRSATGLLVGPGEYGVRMVLRHAGKEETLGEVKLTVELEHEAASRHPDQKPRLEFQRKTLRLLDSFEATLKAATEAQTRLAEFRAALDKAPRATADDRAAVAKAEEALRGVLRLLRGDVALRSRPLNLPDSVGDRLRAVRGDGSRSLAGPTATMTRLLDEAAAGLKEAIAGMAGLRDKALPDLRKRVEKAGGTAPGMFGD